MKGVVGGIDQSVMFKCKETEREIRQSGNSQKNFWVKAMFMPKEAARQLPPNFWDEAFFRCLSCLRHCPAATVRNPVACAAKKLIHRRKGPTATLGSAVPGLRSRHRRYRWKALEIIDSKAQKTADSDVGRALTRRLKIRCAVTRSHAPAFFSATCHASRTPQLTFCVDQALTFPFTRVDFFALTLTTRVDFLQPRRSNQKNYHLICAFCKHRGHTIDRCNMRAGILQRSAALTASESVPSSDAASFDPVSLTTPTYSIADLQALFSQVQALSSSASNSALSMTPGISSEWFLDSACCNHMTGGKIKVIKIREFNL
uniref:Uncharacterized protein n=1 Tax=Fagus sylvatica TaxID=28930 RepID=A0A2N9FHN4_FAGSY